MDAQAITEEIVKLESKIRKLQKQFVEATVEGEIIISSIGKEYMHRHGEMRYIGRQIRRIEDMTDD